MKILFALFGAMGDIFNGLPVVKALREKYPDAEITWLTLPRYRELAECGWVDRVITHGTGRHGNGIPQALLQSERFDLVFYPQGSVNHDEWERSGLHMIDFMAKKCGVAVASRAPEVAIDKAARARVDTFWRSHGLEGATAIAMGCSALSCKSWPLDKFRDLVGALHRRKGTAILLLGDEKDPLLPGVLDCRSFPLKVGIELIRRCALFIGCDSGPAWMASCTNTPMIVFMDEERRMHFNVGFAGVMPEKDIIEISTDSSVRQVLRHVKSRCAPSFLRRMFRGMRRGGNDPR